LAFSQSQPGKVTALLG